MAEVGGTMAAGQPYGQVRLGAAGGGGKGLQCWAPPSTFGTAAGPCEGAPKVQPPLHPLPSLLGSSRAVVWVLPRPGGSLPAAPPGFVGSAAGWHRQPWLLARGWGGSGV